MTLERRREGLVITSLPLQDMALLSLAVPLSLEGEAVLAALLRGEKVFVLPQGLEYKRYRRTAPRGVYEKFTAMERRLREMGIGLLRGHT
jgi:hypothetical protein